MPRLPPEIREIIEDYMQCFQVIMNLPKKRALRRLVNASNQDIMERWLVEKMVRNGGVLSPSILNRTIESILTNFIDRHIMLRSIAISLKECVKSASLRWTFMTYDLYMYPQYFMIYQDSLIFQTISYVTFRL